MGLASVGSQLSYSMGSSAGVYNKEFSCDCDLLFCGTFR